MSFRHGCLTRDVRLRLSAVLFPQLQQLAIRRLAVDQLHHRKRHDFLFRQRTRQVEAFEHRVRFRCDVRELVCVALR